MNTDTYATAKFWSVVALNGGAAHMLNTIAVAGSINIRLDPCPFLHMIHMNKQVLTDISPVRPSACDEDAIPEAVRYPEKLLDNPRKQNAEDLV
jgi:hypothetical protein